MAFFKPIYYEPKARHFEIILRFDAWDGDVHIVPNAMFEEGVQMAESTIKEYSDLFNKLRALEKKKATEFNKLRQMPQINKVRPL